MLCYRCEHRAVFLEESGKAKRADSKENHYVPRPRLQCGDIELSSIGCYMYKPVKPVVVTASDPDDPRPIFGAPIIAGRVQAVRPVGDEVELSIEKVDDGVFVYWTPVYTIPAIFRELWLLVRMGIRLMREKFKKGEFQDA